MAMREMDGSPSIDSGYVDLSADVSFFWADPFMTENVDWQKQYQIITCFSSIAKIKQAMLLLFTKSHWNYEFAAIQQPEVGPWKVSQDLPSIYSYIYHSHWQLLPFLQTNSHGLLGPTARIAQDQGFSSEMSFGALVSSVQVLEQPGDGHDRRHHRSSQHDHRRKRVDSGFPEK